MKLGNSNSVLLLIIALLLLLSACKTTESNRAFNHPGIVYAMVYDGQYRPLSGVAVFVDNELITESDIQGRIIFDMKTVGDFSIKLEKSRYESIIEIIRYDPLNALYFKMTDTVELIALAEDALDKKHYLEAHTYLNRVIALFDASPEALFLKSVAYYLQNMKPEAKEVLEKLLALGFTDDYILDFYSKMDE